jgi:hypothetical protein
MRNVGTQETSKESLFRSELEQALGAITPTAVSATTLLL